MPVTPGTRVLPSRPALSSGPDGVHRGVAAVVIADTPIASGGLVQVGIDARGSRRGKVMSEQKPVENQAETPAEGPAATGELSSESSAT